MLQLGGLSSFIQLFLSEVLAILRSHVAALGMVHNLRITQHTHCKEFIRISEIFCRHRVTSNKERF